MHLTAASTSRAGSRESQAILDAIRHIVQAMRTLSARAETRVGLSAAQVFVLHVLDRHGPLTVNALAAHTLTHQSTVSGVVAKLVDKGMARKRPSPEDGRQVLLSLTAAGGRAAARAPSAAQDELIREIDRLSPRERRDLARLLGRLADRVAPSKAPPTMFFEDASE